ncbi:unnamed protein product [Sphagnum balticum]
MSPFRFGKMAEHASARRGKFPFSFGKSSEHAPELHGNVPFLAQCRNLPRICAECLLLGSEQLRDKPPSSAECPFQVWEG